MKKLFVLCIAIMMSLFFLEASEKSVWVDVSQSQGVPLGGLGNGYVMYGKYGFIRANLDSWPDKYSYGFGTPESIWGYYKKPDAKFEAPWEFVITEGENKWRLIADGSLDGFEYMTAFAYLPKSVFNLTDENKGFNVTIKAFTPLIPHELIISNTPVQIFDITIQNERSEKRKIDFSIFHKALKGKGRKGMVLFNDGKGNVAFFIEDGKINKNEAYKYLELEPGESETLRCYIAWYYPQFKHVKDDFRFYTEHYKNVFEVIQTARENSDKWLERIDKWHNSFDVEPAIKKMWFASLSSVMTSTMLGKGGTFYEVETPHGFLNTMDVNCYSSWVYLINWPELEKNDIDQYLNIIHKDGEMKGYVWHSAVKDKTDYVEEPCFLTRLYRDYMWFNDKEWLDKVFPFAKLAVDRVYSAAGYKYLINSDHGNQSYDMWKMPGLSAYINATWVYGLHSYSKMSEILGVDTELGGEDIQRFKENALANFDKLLWNENGYYNCFYRTPTAHKSGNPTTIFTDQLFGRWMLGIVKDANGVLPVDKVKSAIYSIYKHNLIVDEKADFRGWANALKPGRNIDKSGEHAYMFWFGAQFDLASLLALNGKEEESMDVMKSVEHSLHNNHLAAGEWNMILSEDLSVGRSTIEPGKDTARFPAYPRYKSCWEYLNRMLGMQIDEDYFYFNPFRSSDFSIKDVELAGTLFTVNVEKGWTRILLNGTEVNGDCKVDRDFDNVTLDFKR